MYTSPVFGGFRVQVGTGQKDNVGEANEASIWYSGKLAGDLQAAIGWSEVKNAGALAGCTTCDNRLTMGGSCRGSTLPASTSPPSTPRGSSTACRAAAMRSTTSLKVGYKFGPHAIACSMAAWRRSGRGRRRGDGAFNIAYVWNPIRWAELYASYTLCMLDRTRAGIGDANDITVVTVGTRIRF